MLRTKNLYPNIFALILLLSMLFSIWFLGEEKWRLFKEGERKAYLMNCRDFKTSAEPAVRTMLDDINNAVTSPPYEPHIEDRGRRWTLYRRANGGKIDKISYYMRTSPSAGIYRESENEQKLFPLSIKSIEFRKLDAYTWQIALFREVHTNYGYMGDDFLVYTFVAQDKLKERR